MCLLVCVNSLTYVICFKGYVIVKRSKKVDNGLTYGFHQNVILPPGFIINISSTTYRWQHCGTLPLKITLVGDVERSDI